MKKAVLVVIAIGMLSILCSCGITKKSDKDTPNKNTQQESSTETEPGTEVVLGTELSTEVDTEAETEVVEEPVASDVQTNTQENTNSQQGTNPQQQNNVQTDTQSNAGNATQNKEPETSQNDATQENTSNSEISGGTTSSEETPATESESSDPKPARGAYLVKVQDIANASLSVGDAMYDISVTTIDGDTLTISDLLQEKDMVMLNFWFINCYWCDYEFQYMSPAYLAYEEDIEIIALDAWDSLVNIQYYVEQEQLPFKVAQCSYLWANAFGVSGCPTTVIIDRYGTICDIHVGAITSTEGFTSIFEQYIGDGYTQPIR